MVELLVWLLFAIVLMYVAYLIAIKLIADGTIRTIFLLFLALIFLAIVLGRFGYLPGL